MNPITHTLQADKLIKMALEEDITSEDVSTNAVMPEYRKGKVQLLCKQDGVICGLSVFLRTFRLLDEATEAEFFVSDGDEVKKGQLLAELTGDIRVLLSGERVALNYLQRMSGIATYTRSVAKLLEGSKTKLLDTRKTTPNMRIFEKYAVRVGGGNNHRYNLSDGVLLKDNHIGAAGGVGIRAVCPQNRNRGRDAGTDERSAGRGRGNHHAGQHVPRKHGRSRENGEGPRGNGMFGQRHEREYFSARQSGRGLYFQRRAHPFGAHSRRVFEKSAPRGLNKIGRKGK